MRICNFLAAGFSAIVLAATLPASAAESCQSLEEGRCKIQLSTGIAMAYTEVGDEAGEAVILIHGLTDNIRSWSLSMRNLHKLNPKLHIMAIDLRGHGGSSMPDASACAESPEKCFRPEDFATDVDAFMTAKKIGKATLVGHSLGSMVVQDFSLRYPDRISHAILNATTANAVGNAVLDEYVLKEPIEGAWKTSLEKKGKHYPKDWYLLEPKDADANVEEWLASSWDVDPATDPEFLKPYIPETAGVKLGTWIGATKALLNQDNTKRLERLSVPTLVMWAKQDAIFTTKDQDLLKIALGKAAQNDNQSIFWKEYGVRPLPASGAQESDIGHNIQWSASEMVAADINAFILTGEPTHDLVYSESATNVRKLVVKPGKAIIEKISE